MEFKLIEDLAALRAQGSFVLAAETRHVTHPAFGRRIRSLEAWAGVPLVCKGRGPVRLTDAGEALLAEAGPLLARLQQVRAQWQSVEGGAAAASLLRVCTGRTLAHSLVADWLTRLRPVWRSHRIEVRTAAMAEVAALFERGESDLLVCYEHPALSVGLSGQRFQHATLANDRLLPVSRTDAGGHARHALGSPHWTGYAQSLALGRLLRDRLARLDVPLPPPQVLCDSADAMLELVLKGVGLAWLPHSLVARPIRQGLLKPLGGKADQVHFEVRIYRHRGRQSDLVEAAWAATDR
jgi:LysR family transcriptional regulator, hypochlorite-specific transcription factor HypT